MFVGLLIHRGPIIREGCDPVRGAGRDGSGTRWLHPPVKRFGFSCRDVGLSDIRFLFRIRRNIERHQIPHKRIFYCQYNSIGAWMSHYLVSFISFVTTNWHSNKHILCITECNDNNTNQITDISTRQFISKLRNFSKWSARRAMEQPSHYPVPVSPGYAGGYPATVGSGRMLTIGIRYIFIFGYHSEPEHFCRTWNVRRCSLVYTK